LALLSVLKPGAPRRRECCQARFQIRTLWHLWPACRRRNQGVHSRATL